MKLVQGHSWRIADSNALIILLQTDTDPGSVAMSLAHEVCPAAEGLLKLFPV
jgi:hypothetical protein